jgi:hypothetical protein
MLRTARERGEAKHSVVDSLLQAIETRSDKTGRLGPLQGDAFFLATPDA